MIEHEQTELSYSTNEKSGDSQFRRKNRQRQHISDYLNG